MCHFKFFTAGLLTFVLISSINVPEKIWNVFHSDAFVQKHKFLEQASFLKGMIKILSLLLTHKGRSFNKWASMFSPKFPPDSVLCIIVCC